MIYGLLMAQAERRKVRRQRKAQVLKTLIPLSYIGVGLAIVFDAGVVPWDIRFWLIFAPFFLFGELVLSAVSQVTTKQDRLRGNSGRSEEGRA